MDSVHALEIIQESYLYEFNDIKTVQSEDVNQNAFEHSSTDVSFTSDMSMSQVENI
jgi:hypothetical protein